MPLFPYFPYDEEEERRRRLGLPPAPLTGRPAPSTSMEPPAGTERPMRPGRAGRGEEISEARDVYMRGTPGRGRGALAGILQGLVQGLESGQGLGAGVRGAITGGITGAVSPKTIRRQQFEREVAPQINERFDIEAAEARAASQAEEDALGRQYKTAQIGALNRSNLPAPVRPRQPIRSDRGLYDPESSSIIPGTEPLPKEQRPDRRFTNRGMVDVSKLPPEDLRKLTPYQRPSTGGAGRGDRPPPQGAFGHLNELDELKREAEDAWRQWREFTPTDSQPEDTPQLKEGRRRTAQAALDQYNQAAQRFGEIYSDSFEVSQGQGWSHIKRRGGRGQKQLPAPTQQSEPPKRSRKELDRLGVKDRDPLGIR